MLLIKLTIYKFDSVALKWIKTYLTDRLQCIIDKQVCSNLQQVKAWVPQCSVLGPILFLLFINYLPLFISESYVEFYAEDTTVHAAHKNLNVVEEKLQTSSDRFNNWCYNNDLSVNLKKTSVMTLETCRNLLNADNLQIFIKKEIIEHVESQKLLGVINDRTLNWNKQIDAVCLNIKRRITLLKMLSKYVNKNSLIQYYNSYILPIFDYGCLIWGRCMVSNIHRLLKLQKRSARIILNADMFSKLKWLPFPK